MEKSRIHYLNLFCLINLVFEFDFEKNGNKSRIKTSENLRVKKFEKR